MNKDDFTSNALAAMERAGWQDGQDWPVGTKQIDGKDRGGWGNFSYRAWELPTGAVISWNSDDREYSLSRRTK